MLLARMRPFESITNRTLKSRDDESYNRSSTCILGEYESFFANKDHCNITVFPNIFRSAARITFLAPGGVGSNIFACKSDGRLA